MATHAYITDKEELQRLRGIRKDIEASLERMLTVLDTLDGDPDLEDDELEDGGDDEPALGWSGVSQLRLTAHEDGETSLGWANQGSQLRLHAEAIGDELEDDDPGGGNIEDEPHDGQHEDLEPDSDGEPSLGAPENPEGDQSHWSRGDNGGDDNEADPLDGEQWRLLSYEQQKKAREAARDALEQLRRKGHSGVGVAGRGICNVTIIGPDLHPYMVEKVR